MSDTHEQHTKSIDMYGEDKYPVQDSNNPFGDGQEIQVRRDILRGLQLYW